MPDIEKLMEEILREKPEITKNELEKLIQEKKERVGAGHLSESGACWLVAGDLGVSLEQISTGDLELKDLYVGASEVTVVGRILTIYPDKVYSRKDSTEGHLRRLVIFDDAATAKLSIWEEKTALVDELGIGPGSVIRVIRAYSKAGLDGDPVLNLGSRGEIEKVDDRVIVSKLPTVEAITIDVGDVTKAGSNLSVQGVLRQEPRHSEFVRRDGKPGTVLQLYLRDRQRPVDIRVAIWNNNSPELRALRTKQLVRLVNLRSKLLPEGGNLPIDFELHGDEGTFVETLGIEETSEESVQEDNEPKRFRILSIGPKTERDAGEYISSLIVGYSEKYYTLIVKGTSIATFQKAPVEQIVECSPRQLGTTALLCDDETPLTLVADDDSSIPKSEQLFRKVNESGRSEGPIFLQVIALSRTVTQEITTRDGLVVKRAEITVGDETGEVKLVAWRHLTNTLEGIMPGERIRIKGAVSQAGMGDTLMLLMKPYSSIEQLG